MSKKLMQSLIQEKFGFTKDMTDLTKKGGYPTEGKLPQPSAHPMEKFRKIIKAALGATTSEQDEAIENIFDFKSILRLAHKHGLTPFVINGLKTIEVEINKPKTKIDSELIAQTWEDIKNQIPYWFIALIPHNKEELPEEDKLEITNLLNYMAHFNKESEKAGKELAKNTEHGKDKTQAEKNLEKAMKDTGNEDVKHSKVKPEEIESEAKVEDPKVPVNHEDQLEGEEYTGKKKDK